VNKHRLVIVEGIIGSGKSTTIGFIATSLEQQSSQALPIPEGTMPHPTCAFAELAHSYQPWLDATPAELAEKSLSKWRSFVDSARGSDTVAILDGQLFHGDLTNLFLMEAGRAMVAEYCRAVEKIIHELTPLLIYFYQKNVERALRDVAARRGDAWVKHQVDWKLRAPYSRRRGLEGLEGLIALYKDYRELTDKLYARLDLTKLAIENSEQDWLVYYERISQELAVGR
jgi:thymidylate kinase